MKVLKNKWQSIWIAIQGTEGLKPGKYPVEITFTIPGVDFWGTPVNSQKQNLESSISVEIEVIDACLPEQNLYIPTGSIVIVLHQCIIVKFFRIFIGI